MRGSHGQHHRVLAGGSVHVHCVPTQRKITRDTDGGLASELPIHQSRRNHMIELCKLAPSAVLEDHPGMHVRAMWEMHPRPQRSARDCYEHRRESASPIAKFTFCQTLRGRIRIGPKCPQHRDNSLLRDIVMCAGLIPVSGGYAVRVGQALQIGIHMKQP